jgi:ATP-binding cassette subfamily F protein uup
METLDVLEEMLADYPGTVLLISHDRDFLDRLVGGVIAPEGNGRWIEYAGGYSDMLAQRGGDLVREPRKPEAPKPDAAKPAKAPAAPAAQVPPARSRMTFKDKHALETLPTTIAALQAEARALQAKLDDPQFYVRDRAGFETVSAALGDVQHRIAAAEEQWLELEIRREEIAGG